MVHNVPNNKTLGEGREAQFLGKERADFLEVICVNDNKIKIKNRKGEARKKNLLGFTTSTSPEIT